MPLVGATVMEEKEEQRQLLHTRNSTLNIYSDNSKIITVNSYVV
jgi:hypothetical protein